MRLTLLTLGLLASMGCLAAQDNSVNFIAQIESIKVNRSAINDQGKLIPAERIFVNGDTPCGKDTIHMTASSLQMTQENYEKFLQDVWNQAQDEKYFRFTATACEGKGSQLATNIQVCRKDICDNKYIVDDTIIWVGGDIDSFYVLSKKEATDAADYFIRLPLEKDKTKNLWKVTGWYLGDNLDISNEGKLKAFVGYTDSENFSSQKFVSTFTTYYRSGQKAAQFTFNDKGVQDGEFNGWHKNGKPSQKFTYVNGEINGEFTAWNDNGTIASKSNFINGKHVDGACNHYDGHGKLLREHSYLNGKYDGKYVDYYADGKVNTEKFYKNDHLVGDSKEFYPNGQLKSLEHFDEQGRRDGAQEKYLENGTMKSREIFKHDRKITAEEWYQNGNKRYSRQFDENGKDNGKDQQWAENGQLISETHYSHGQVSSEKTWTEAGAPLTEAVYKKGTEESVKRRWSEKTGKLYSEVHFNASQPSGITKKWDETTGKLILETTYNDGFEDGLRKEYDPQTGELTLEKWNAGLSDVNKFVNNQPSLKKYKNGKLIVAGCDITKLLNNPDEVTAQAKKGDAKSQVQLGLYYDGCSEFKKAESWMLKAAKQKNGDALYYLSQLYLKGKKDVIAEDIAKYLQYTEQAAEAGNSQAQYQAGINLLPAEVCSKIMSSCDARYRNPTSNLDKALYWLNKAAEQKEDTGALDILSTLYGYGIGVPEDGEKAMAYCRALEKMYPESDYVQERIARIKAHLASSAR